MTDPRTKELWPLARLRTLIQDVPNFPKPGIVFKDITPILAQAEAFQSLGAHLAAILPAETTHVMAIESRGFILAAAAAQHRPVGLILARKPGKLPRQTWNHSYGLEYGTDTLEIHQEDLRPGHRVIVMDDVLATGGTAQAAGALATKAGGTLLGFRFFLEIEALGGRFRLQAPAKSLLGI